MIQFVKEPLDCICKGFTKGFFKLLRMPRQIYEEVVKLLMPMPILKEPKIGDNANNLQYMSFVDARRLPFTNKIQSSLETITLHVAAKKKNSVAT